MLANPLTFVDSALDGGARWARVFEQRALLRACPRLRRSAGLCAVLIRLWWTAQRHEGDLLAEIAARGPELEEELAQLLLAVLAPSRLLPAAEYGEPSRQLLELKYGTSDPKRLRERMRENGCDDLRELDLTVHFRARLSSRRHAATWSEVTDALLVINSGPALMIAHVPPVASSSRLSSGHRLALLWTGDEWRFFDPNFGEAAFPPEAPIRRWMEDFGRDCGHSARIAGASSAATVWQLTERDLPSTTPESTT